MISRPLKLVVPVSGSVDTIVGPSLSGGPPVGLDGVAHEYAIATVQIKIEFLKKSVNKVNLSNINLIMNTKKVHNL